MPSSAKPVVRIVTPGTREANNGNWRTAKRWAGMLAPRFRVIVQTRWEGEPCEVLLALHAKRSADSILAFRDARPQGGLGVVLTGTDLYRDLPGSLEAMRSLELADAIVTLQDEAPRLLAAHLRRKTRVIFQSARILPRKRKARGRLDCVAVGHLRVEKDPETLLNAVAALPHDLPIRIRHIGAPLDPKLARAARSLAAREPRYRWSGALPHGLTRAAMRSAHLLVHPSIVEGGANVIVEAIASGTPVVASRIPGNVGMLGAGYPGYFEARDASALAGLLVRALEEPSYLRRLDSECSERRRLFRPEAEARAVRQLVTELVQGSR